MRDFVLHIEPRQIKTWHEFIATAPPASVALDGYVYGGPRYYDAKQIVNFNHHENVDRLATRATCGQVYIAIKQGLFRALIRPDRSIHIFINDCDQDVCMALWLLYNHERIEGVKSEPLISRLVFALDMLDATGGAYPFATSSELMRQVAWIFRPYTEARPMLSTMNKQQMNTVIEAVLSRITEYTLGRGKEIEPSTEYSVTYRGVRTQSQVSWSLVNETGPEARAKMFEDGIHAFVSVRPIDTTRWAYSIGRTSQYIDFPLPQIYAALNAAEKCESEDCWGGSDLIGGSPRKNGSVLSPQQIIQMINAGLHDEA